MRSMRFFVGLCFVVAGAGVLHHFLVRPPDLSASRQTAHGTGAPQRPRPAILVPKAGASPQEPSARIQSGEAVGGIRGRVHLQGSPVAAPRPRVVTLPLHGARPTRMSITSEAGDYELPGLTPGRYLVSAGAPGWALAPMSLEEQLVLVEAGRVVTDVDLVLAPGGSIAGTVVNAATGTPVESAIVSLDSRYGVETDSAGSFEVDGAPPGALRITAAAAGFVSCRQDLEVRVGQRATVSFSLEPGGTIEGEVIDPGGISVPGARVWSADTSPPLEAATDSAGHYVLEGVPLASRGLRLWAGLEERFLTWALVEGFEEGQSRIEVDLRLQSGTTLAGLVIDELRRPVSGARIFTSSSRIEPLAVSNEQGQFRVEGVPPHEALVTARSVGFLPASVKLGRFLTEEERSSIELQLQRGQAVAGKVTDVRGAPVHGAWVAAEEPGDHAGLYPGTRSGPDGSFLLEGLGKESRVLSVGCAGYCVAREIPVIPGAEGLVIQLEEEGMIDLRVVEQGSGHPIDRATVAVELAENHLRKRPGEHSIARYSAPATLQLHGGRARLRAGIASAVFYRLTVSSVGFEECVLEEVEAWSGLERREPLTVKLKKGGDLAGRVISTTTGTPLEGAHVLAVPQDRDDRTAHWLEVWRSSAGPGRAATTDREGKFALRGLPDRPVLLLFQKRGHGRAAVAGVSAGIQEQVFRLAPGAILEASVRAVGGRTLPGVEASLVVDGESYPRTLTDTEGKLRIDDLPAGQGELRLRMPSQEWVPWPSRVTLLEGETTHLELTIPTGGIDATITLRGTPVGEAEILLLPSGGGLTAFLEGSRGRYHLGCLFPGTYQLCVKGYDPGTGRKNSGLERTIEVGDGVTPCTIELASTPVRGRVVNGQTGRPVHGARVCLYDAEGQARCTVSCDPDEESFELEAPGSGSYWISAALQPGEVVGGWTGPLLVEEGTGLSDLLLPVGGAADVTITAVESSTLLSLRGAHIAITAGNGAVFRLTTETDAAGIARFERLPAGSYRIEAEGDSQLVATETLELTSGTEERRLILEPASWIVVEPAAGRVPQEHLGVEATVLAGGDPGWRRVGNVTLAPRLIACPRSTGGSPPRLAFKIRPGSYRLRLKGFDLRAPSLSGPRNPLVELDVTVPEASEVVVRLPDGR